MCGFCFFKFSLVEKGLHNCAEVFTKILCSIYFLVELLYFCVAKITYVLFFCLQSNCSHFVLACRRR